MSKNKNADKNYNFIQQQIFVWMGFVIVIIVGINLFFNNFVLDKIYLQAEEREIIKIYSTINEGDLTDSELDGIKSFCSINNMTLFLVDGNFKPIAYNYYNHNEENLDFFIQYIKNCFSSGTKRFIYKSNENIVFEDKNCCVIRFSNNGLEYLELRGILDSGEMLLIRVSIASIKENISFFNTFSSIILLLGLSFGLVLSWAVCRNITKPIKTLTSISDEMIKLNFDTKYSLNANNEIDILGKNFNILSTTLKKSLDELRETNIKLEKANIQLEEDLKEKEKIDEMRKDFISNVSHELKTPIALIQGYAEAIKDGIGDDKETNDFYTDIIIDESQKMNKLVKQLIDLNQLESGSSLDISEFNICDLVEGVVKNSSTLIKDKKAKVSIKFETKNMFVEGDEFKIEQVILNYLTNALNHIDNKKQILINVKTMKDKVKVSIFNTGQNIPDNDLLNIWDKFYKVDKARTRAYGGSGVGLSIVKAIITSLGQDYGVENKSNGVEFYFTLKKVNSEK